MKNEDLTGKIIGNIEVLSLVGSDKNKRKMYKIRCIKCGKEDIRDSSSIRKYGTFKCYCKDKKIQDHIEYMVGKQFGDFKIEYLKERKNGNNYFHVKCIDCGYEEDVKLTGRFNVLNTIPKEERDKILEDRYKGKIIGSLKIESLKENNGNGKVIFYCTCIDCGAEHIPVRLDSIKKYGKTSKCYCSNYDEDLTGKRFTDLDVLYLTRKENGKKYYNCRCIKCGDIVECRSDDIKKYGKSSKCSCNIKKPRNIESLIGRKFGYLEVKEYVGKDNSGGSLWKCLCTKCNENYTITSRSNLLKKNNPVTMCRKCADKLVAEKKLNNLSGKIIDNIQVLYRNTNKEDTKDYKVTIWRCKCLLCGKEFDSIGSKLVGENHITCCQDCRENWRITHGMRNTDFYNVWENMKQRCYNHNNPKYEDYGERGILICDEWKYSFENFYHDMYNSYCEYKSTHPEEYVSIDRIDNNKGYFKDNCRWVGRFEQENNTRFNSRYNYKREEYTVREILDLGIADSDRTYDSIKSAINNKNMDIKDAILSPKRKEAINPLAFFDKDGNRIQDKYNNRHDDLYNY